MTFEQIWPLALYVVFNAAVQALEEPTENDGRRYRFLYNFAHALACNINVVRKGLRKQ